MAMRRARNHPYPTYANSTTDREVVSEKEKARVAQQDA